MPDFGSSERSAAIIATAPRKKANAERDMREYLIGSSAGSRPSTEASRRSIGSKRRCFRPKSPCAARLTASRRFFPNSIRSVAVFNNVHWRKSPTTLSRILRAKIDQARIFVPPCQDAAGKAPLLSLTSWEVTSNFVRSALPKEVVIATSVASRPTAISTRPMRGKLWRASKVHQRSSR